MSSYQGIRLYLLFISILALSYDLALGTVTPGNAMWFAGYKVIFLVAAVKSITSYVCMKLNGLLEMARQLQYSALSTTSKGEVFALYREERTCASDNTTPVRYTKAACGYKQRILFNPHDRYDPPPVFWCTFTTFVILYNTAHLALVPLSCTSPLFFGAPACVLYWGIVRTSQILLMT